MRVVAPIGEQLFCFRRELELDAAFDEQLLHALELDLDDVADLVAAELVEDDHIVDAVQELGLEVRAQRLVDAALHLAALALAEFDDELAPQIRSQDQHGVLEIDGAALAIGEAPIVEDLEQRVEDVRVCLLDLVEENDTVWASPHRFGQIAALVVADVAGRRADQPRHRVLLHELTHVDADHRLLVVEQEAGERACGLGLADPCRPEEDERADRPIRVLQAGARAAHRVRHHLQRLVLADDALAQLLFHVQQLFLLAFHHFGDRDARPLRDQLGDLFGADFFRHQRALLLRCFELLLGRAEILLELNQLAVANLGGALEVAGTLHALELGVQRLALLLQFAHAADRLLLGFPVGLLRIQRLGQVRDLRLDAADAFAARRVALLLQRLALDFEAHHLALRLVELLGHRVDLHAHARGGFVDQVDRLVGQEAVGDVAVRERRGGDQRGVLDADAVVDFVALLQAAQDRDGVLDVRFGHQHGLEAALERGVLLDVLAVLVERRRADTSQLAARERGLQQVRGVGRAFGGARADDGVQLVDEQDHLTLRVGDFLQHGLQPILELAAVLRARDHRAHVERDDAAIAQTLGHIAGNHALREALDDRGLADARFPNQHWIVLGAARQHLDHAADLVVAADDRIELALARQLGEVAAVFFERLVLRLGILIGDAPAAAHRLQRLQDRVARDARFAQCAAGGVAIARGEAEQQMLRRDVLVLQLICGLEGRFECLAELAPDARLRGAARHARQCGERLVELRFQRIGADAQFLQHRNGGALGLVEQRAQQVQRLDDGVTAARRERLGFRERFLAFDRQFVELHGKQR